MDDIVVYCLFKEGERSMLYGVVVGKLLCLTEHMFTHWDSHFAHNGVNQ